MPPYLVLFFFVLVLNNVLQSSVPLIVSPNVLTLCCVCFSTLIVCLLPTHRLLAGRVSSSFFRDTSCCQAAVGGSSSAFPFLFTFLRTFAVWPCTVGLNGVPPCWGWGPDMSTFLSLWLSPRGVFPGDFSAALAQGCLTCFCDFFPRLLRGLCFLHSLRYLSSWPWHLLSLGPGFSWDLVFVGSCFCLLLLFLRASLLPGLEFLPVPVFKGSWFCFLPGPHFYWVLVLPGTILPGSCFLCVRVFTWSLVGRVMSLLGLRLF